MFDINSKNPMSLQAYIESSFSPIEKQLYAKLSDVLQGDGNLTALGQEVKALKVLAKGVQMTSKKLVSKKLIRPEYVSQFLCGGNLSLKDELTDWGVVFATLLKENLFTRILSMFLDGPVLSIFNDALGTKVVSRYKKELGKALFAVYLSNI